MDNSTCKKAVKSFKIKMQRKISCMSGKKGKGREPIVGLQETEFLVANKYEGCAAKTKLEKTIEFQVPLTDKKFGSVENLHPELRHMVKMFTDSAKNSLFTVEYELHIFIKHQSKLEFGMGNSVIFPIEIKSDSQNLPWVGTKE